MDGASGSDLGPVRCDREPVSFYHHFFRGDRAGLCAYWEDSFGGIGDDVGVSMGMGSFGRSMDSTGSIVVGIKSLCGLGVGGVNACEDVLAGVDDFYGL